MNKFTGDLSWIHTREGHAGRPYWPGGMSGVTIDPGVDLGHVDSQILIANYSDLMTADQLEEALNLKGITGKAAEKALGNLEYLRDFRISPQQAEAIFPTVATPYWNGVLNRWPSIADAPSDVQTVMLSLAFNRGYNNSRLEALTEYINRKDWLRMGEVIAGMQQDHSLPGIRFRRRLEGTLITHSKEILTSNR